MKDLTDFINALAALLGAIGVLLSSIGWRSQDQAPGKNQASEKKTLKKQGGKPVPPEDHERVIPPGRKAGRARNFILLGLLFVVLAIIIFGFNRLTCCNEPLAGITNVSSDAHVGQFVTVLGSYRADLADELWIFTRNPDGRYYPQTLFSRQGADDCQVQSTFKQSGKWEANVVLGNAADVGQAFNLVVTTADAATHRSLADQQRAWCLRKSFPGLEKLPPGVTEVQRVKVIRTDEDLEPTDVSNAVVPGEVSITSPSNGGTVSQEAMIEGTYGKTTGNLWVLVHPYYGRWYPQSMNPCTGDHTRLVGNNWTVRAVFGGLGEEGRAFDIVVILADAHANEFLSQKQAEWCQAGYFPGLLDLQLPQGISQKLRYRVYRAGGTN